MSIDMTGLERLGSVGLDKVFTEIPKGKAKEGIHFAFKIKKAQWLEGKYGHRYGLDVVIRTLDMSTVLSSSLWKVYPSMLPQDIIESIDCDIYNDTWWLVRTVVNPRSKATPPSTMLSLIDTQQGLDAQSGPSKPAAVLASEAHQASHGVPVDSSMRGQPAPGEVEVPGPVIPVESSTAASPGNPCPHDGPKHFAAGSAEMEIEEGFYCKDCGERVG